ncbi:hypothetical protein PPL_07981 [Heterostelium album PN500]|uniref:Uncharacterized protein n=1 Tax=Heterostelium pallidum (strain ATCC 26659 / Pp 5 / PN500) TaxID=670386 RepID=D3BHH9_HETP5|nr:hypothetical protein PPL_07981 [Heterostelium album PN500]EFA79156.1 hypothetical protein PPL_07981 [Heterostelium album PN500]|eukprot:XP_020431278.1 hypothetical protein PPL_07981 [Heterostelium album PN500]
MATTIYQFDQLISKSLESLVDQSLNLIDIGLLIGQQQNETKATFLSMISTPKPFDNQNVEYKTTKDIDDVWVAEHSRLVSKMLYGGINITGICLSVPSINVVNDANLAQILKSIRTTLIQERSYLTNIIKTLYVLIYIRSTKQYILKSISSASTDNKFKQITDIKFTQPTQDFLYLSLNTTLNIKMKLNSSKQFNVEMFNEMKQLIEKNLYSQLKKSIVFTVDNQYCPMDSTGSTVKLSEFANGKSPIVVVDALMSGTDIVLGRDSAVTLHFGNGVQQYRAYALKSESITNTLEYLLHDIINSLESRVELLIDNNDVDQSNMSKSTEITLPRRASVQWINNNIELCDYLYDAEGYYDFQQRIQELTNLEFSHQSESTQNQNNNSSSLPSWIKSIEKNNSLSKSNKTVSSLPPTTTTKSTTSTTSTKNPTTSTTTATTLTNKQQTKSNSNIQYLAIAVIIFIIALAYQLNKSDV